MNAGRFDMLLVPGALTDLEYWLGPGIGLPFAPVPELEAAVDTVVEWGSKQSKHPAEGIAAGPVYPVARKNAGERPRPATGALAVPLEDT